MKRSHITGAVCAIVLTTFTSSSFAFLTPKLGGTVVYDDDRDITWMADPNLAASNTFGVAGINANGTMSWATANSWIDALNAANYLGFNNWRMPTTLVPDSNCVIPSSAGTPSTDSTGLGCLGSEMGHLFYNELSGSLGVWIEYSGDPDLTLFPTIPTSGHWSSTEFSISNAFTFAFADGSQGSVDKDISTARIVWAVRSGDILTAPVYSCFDDIFESPFNVILTLNKKVKKAIPVKMQLLDANGYLIADSDISTPPVVNISYTPGSGADDSNNSDLVPPGLADDGNEFRYDDPYWLINLSTKQFTSAGTYKVTAVAGDASYTINAGSCSGTFVRLP